MMSAESKSKISIPKNEREKKLQEIAERVWQLWRTHLRRERERRGKWVER